MAVKMTAIMWFCVSLFASLFKSKFRLETDRIHPTRVHRPYHRPWRGAPASRAEMLRSILQCGEDAPLPDEDAPVSRPIQNTGRIISHAILGGLHLHYVRI